MQQSIKQPDATLSVFKPEEDYEIIHSWLTRINADMTAPKLHGMICGFVCAGPRMNGRSWFEIVLGLLKVENQSMAESRQMLIELYDVSCQQFRDAGHFFHILLPLKESLRVRAEAVGQWCLGVIAGLELAGIHIQESDDEDVRDAMFHLQEFARINYDSIEYGEEDESAYHQVIDYLHDAIVMLYEEFAVRGQKEESGKLDGGWH